MQFTHEVEVPFERERVFRAYRDELPKFTEYLPNVRRIEVLSRSEEPDAIQIVNVWYGGGEVSAAARAVLSEAMLSWKDFASWKQADWACEWHIETRSFTQAVTCAGLTQFLEAEEGTLIKIEGKIGIDAGQITGVPKLLQHRVSVAIEEYLTKKIIPNVVEANQGLVRFLQKQERLSEPG